MRRRIWTRLATFAASLLAATALIFWVTNALPGNVAAAILGVNASPGEVEKLSHELGLDRPWLVRYSEWVWGLMRGDFGTSIASGDLAGPEIGERLSVTGWLVGFGMIGAMILAVPLGAFAAIKRRRASGFAASALSQVGLSVPAFWLGLLLVLLFAVRLRWLPANGYVPLSEDPGAWARHLVLPVASLALVQAAVLSRYVRSAVIEVLNEDYYRTARSIGWSQIGALVRHGSRNIALSVITVLALQLATLLVGAIIIEQVFALPGLGTLLLSAVGLRDLVVVQGIVFVLVFAVLTLNLITDLAYLAIDPRLRTRGRP
ncbi:MAG: ABC transporter permease [Propionibacteriaceae bacterium]|nr:ABC transporter permease [Propionibacteriaceae bacterium]